MHVKSILAAAILGTACSMAAQADPDTQPTVTAIHKSAVSSQPNSGVMLYTDNGATLPTHPTLEAQNLPGGESHNGYDISGQMNNGISVFNPTIYDIRDFEEIETQLSTALQALKLVDNQTVINGIGNVQSQNLKSQSVGISAANTTGPTLPTAPTLGTVTPGGEARLQEELELESEIMNLELMLRPSLSDRVYHDGNYTGEPRRVVVRFDITTDPPPKYDWDYANVEVTVRSEDVNATAPPKLIALLPEQTGNNVSNGSATSNSLSVGPIASFLNFGLGLSGGSQSQAVNREFSVIGYQEEGPTLCTEPLQSELENSLTFVWQLRPDLGHARIDVGTRHYFAVLEVPGIELFASPKFDLDIRTFWKKAAKQRSGAVIPESLVTYDPVAVTTDSEDNLDRLTEARIENADSVEDIGSGKLVITGRGKGLNSNCQLVMGGTTYTPSTSTFNIGVDSSYSLIANGIDLCTMPTINASLTSTKSPDLSAASVPILLDGHFHSTCVGESYDIEHHPNQIRGFQISAVAVSKTTTPQDNTKTAIDITLSPRGSNIIGALVHPLVNVHNTVYGVSPNSLSNVAVETTPEGNIDKYTITVVVPTADLVAAPLLVVADPFRGSGFIDSADASNAIQQPAAKPNPPITITDVKILSETQNLVVLAVEGTGLSKVKSIQFGSQSPFTPKDPDGNPIVHSCPQSNFNELQNVLVTYPDGPKSLATVSVPVPAVTVPSQASAKH